MYPDFHFLFQEWFGIDLPVLSLLKTFGFLVAMAFLAAGYTLYLELKRKEDDGLIPSTIEEITVGQAPTLLNYITAALIFFFVGFKLVGLITNHETASGDPLNFIFSMEGNLWAGLIAAIGAVAFTYFSFKKNDEGKGPITKKVRTYPSIRVGDMAVLAAITGFGGAKIFNTFEDWDKFIVDPFGVFFQVADLLFMVD